MLWRRCLPIITAVFALALGLRVAVNARSGQAAPSGAFAAAASASAREQSTATNGDTSPKRPDMASREGGPEYVGSAACGGCHQTANEQWESSLHIRMTKPVQDASILADFRDGTRFADHGRSYEFGRKDGKPFVRIAFGERTPETFAVDYTLGFKRYQGFLSKLSDGRIYVLPSFWHVESKRWLDWKELAPVPDGAHDLRQIWNINCFNCHATNLAQGYNIAAGKYETTWTEMGIGCEACHGPGSEHVSLMQVWAKNPALQPAYDDSNASQQLSATLKIFSTRSATPRQVFDMCAYCHGNKANMFTGFRPGNRYEDYALPFLISAPIPDNDFQGEFWPDGRPNRFNRPQAVMQSGCFQSGKLACTNCHVAHGSKNPFSLKVNITQGRTGDLLCTQCHTSPRASVDRAATSFVGAELEKHTFHKADSAGSRCINCHMSDLNWRLLIRRRDHTYKPPVPEITAQFGEPNACTTCHDERPPEWAARQMDLWWGNAERRRAELTVAEAMYRAGSGDTSVAAALARIAVERSHSAFVRASAADYLAEFMIAAQGGSSPSNPYAAGDLQVQSQTSFAKGDRGAARRTSAPLVITPALINAMIGAASDPEAIVRAAAVRALGALTSEQRVLNPVIARLVDPARVVRARTAEVLMGFGVSQLPGAAGGALARAQDDYAASLRAFPDVAANHAALAWLEAERGRLAEALAAADLALQVNPRYARPWVVKGVVFARQEKYADAIAAWKKARSIEPSYPNIDRLIEEGEKRK
jgi:predicted CXXCH cytochrome family protein